MTWQKISLSANGLNINYKMFYYFIFYQDVQYLARSRLFVVYSRIINAWVPALGSGKRRSRNGHGVKIPPLFQQFYQDLNREKANGFSNARNHDDNMALTGSTSDTAFVFKRPGVITPPLIAA